MAFGVGLKGPCPVCGAPEMSCAGASDPRAVERAVGAGFFVGAQSADAGARWRSREHVYERDPRTGHTVQKYGVGTPIPLIEALRQSVASWEELAQTEVAELARHGVARPPKEPPAESPQEPPAQEAGSASAGKKKGADRPPKDKMVRRGQVVRK